MSDVFDATRAEPKVGACIDAAAVRAVTNLRSAPSRSTRNEELAPTSMLKSLWPTGTPLPFDEAVDSAFRSSLRSTYGATTPLERGCLRLHISAANENRGTLLVPRAYLRRSLQRTL